MEPLVSCSELVSDSVKNVMIKCTDLQSIGRMGRTCKSWNSSYRDLMICKTPQSDECFSFGCSLIKNNFDACTDLLAFYAKKYEKEESNDDFYMFKHLWRYHEVDRLNGVKDVSGIREPTIQDCLKVYAGDCTDANMIRTIQSFRLSYFLSHKNVSAIKTMLLDKRGFRTYVWSLNWRDDVEKNLKIHDHGSIMSGVCDLNDIKFIRSLIKDESSWKQVVQSLIERNNNVLVKNLIEQYIEWGKKNRFDLFNYVLKHGDCCVWEVIELLFLDDINAVDQYNRSLLYFAIEYGNSLVVDFLLDKGSKIDIIATDHTYRHQPNRTIFERFIRTCYFTCEGPLSGVSRFEFFSNIGQKLYNYGADIDAIDKNGRSLLMRISDYHSTDGIFIAQGLIEAGAQIDVVDEDGRSALHYYSGFYHRYKEKDKSSLVKKLIEYKIDVNLKDKQGKTALHYACETWSINTVKELIKAHADIEISDNEGNTPFLLIFRHISPDHNKEAINLINYLLNIPVNLHSVNKDGDTALHLFCAKDLGRYYKGKYSRIIRSLVDKGININAINNEGKTAIDVAPKWMKELLISYKEKIFTKDNPSISVSFLSFDLKKPRTIGLTVLGLTAIYCFVKFFKNLSTIS